ncbi:MAG: hypothetical protein WCG21_11410 [Eubacteriales bacterium]
MRFEPPEFTDSNPEPKKEMPLFRVAVSHHPVILYLFLCVLFYCAYRLGEPVLLADPLSAVLRVFLAGWALFLMLFLLSALMFLYNRVDVTSQRIHGRMFSLRHHHFSVPLADIASVSVSQLFFAGPLHYGRLTLRIPNKRLYILYVKEPLEVKKALDREIAKARPDGL